MPDPRRQLPSVDALLHQPDIQPLVAETSREDVLAAVREALAAARRRRSGPVEDWGLEIRERLVRRMTSSLQPVLNATGVVLHTNLGRAPLARAAAEAMARVSRDYSTLEFNLASGTRGHRSEHGRRLLAELTGAEDALVVNNAAGALVLGLNALSGGRPVLISRGELIEIGGSFRIPDIMEASGVALVEIGTTNRTHLEDYERGMDQAGAILTVHRSNFEQRGFVTTPAPADLAQLAQRHGVPYIHDVGSGLLLDLSPFGLATEPRVPDAVGAGADLVVFSGDKLLGGPQAGCLVGGKAAIDRCRRHPLARALRADRFTLAGLEATLALYLDPERARREIPVLSMLTASAEEMARKASALLGQVPVAFEPGLAPGESAVGGGAFPGAALPTTLVTLHYPPSGAAGLALRLRLGSPPVVARVVEERVVLDPRTLRDDQLALVGAALGRVLEG